MANRISVKTIEKYTAALKYLYQELNVTKHTGFHMTKFIRTAGLSANAVKVMIELGYISQLGNKKGAQYKWVLGRNPEPKDARRVLTKMLEERKTTREMIVEKRVKQRLAETSASTKKAEKIDPVHDHKVVENQFVQQQKVVEAVLRNVVNLQNVLSKIDDSLNDLTSQPAPEVTKSEEKITILWGLYTKVKTNK